MKQRIRGICGILLTAAVLCAWGCGSKPQGRAERRFRRAASATPEKETIDYLNELTEIEFTQAKNVILFIGDGMGMNHIPATDAIAGGQYNGKLAIEYLPNQGTAITLCNEGEPDSASGGTALACGYKSNRKYLAMNVKREEVQSVVELAHSLGKKTGVVTNESIVDATPAAFTIHAPNRDDESDIAKLQIETSVADLIIGGGKAMYDKALEDSAYRQMLEDNRITYATTWEEVEAYPNEGRLIATLTDDYFEKAEEAQSDACADDGKGAFPSERIGRGLFSPGGGRRNGRIGTRVRCDGADQADAGVRRRRKSWNPLCGRTSGYDRYCNRRSRYRRAPAEGTGGSIRDRTPGGIPYERNAEI